MDKDCIPTKLFIVFLMLSSLPISKTHAVEITTLLQLKEHFRDPLNHLESWKPSKSPCTFYGVTCDSISRDVIGISLANISLSGELSPSISNLHGLITLDLASNALFGTIPVELVSCINLQHLNLSYNSFTGALPDLSPLKSLQVLDLSSNGFTGKFPDWVGSLSNLVQIGLAQNRFDEGEIPESLGRLSNLSYLFLAQCNFIGQIPPSIFELKSLGTIDFSSNKISGTFPVAITNLHNLSKIELFENQFTGEIPNEIGKLINLQEFDISRNQMSGTIPHEMGNLKNLTVIHLFQNNFWGEIPIEFGELQFLKSFSIYFNNFSGQFPPNFGMFSPLNSIDISENNLSGEFPKFLCKNNHLQYLLALKNRFSDEFPDTYSACKTLLRLRISSNNFSGVVSDGLWSLPNAVIIDLADNSFTGEISSEIGGSTSLTQLYVQNNGFSSQIPVEIGKLSKLQKLYAFNNAFSGSIPPQIGQLKQLTSLHLGRNSLTGPIPSELYLCDELVDMDLSQNSLSGSIPESLSSLTSLNSLNLSMNMLSGLIPDGLQALKLSSADFSNNELSGAVSLGLQRMAGDEAFIGNPGLCIDERSGSQRNNILRICRSARKHEEILGKKLLISIIAFMFMFILCTTLFYISCRNFHQEVPFGKKDMEAGMDNGNSKLVSFHTLEIESNEILQECNLIGSGSSGRVYRVDLKNGGSVAVKQLWKKSGGKFPMTEISILAKIRHINILKLYACLLRGELSCLVLEYMPKGNLYGALHRENKDGSPELDWNLRHKIAVGAAKGILYLHQDCSPSIVHRDIKSTNILLDEEFEAKIADFGIAKIMEASESSYFAGTHGYMAPELAYSVKLTEKVDVYSFGVVLLELLTGRRPIEPEFGEGNNIVYWVTYHLSNQNITRVLDHRISSVAEESMIQVLKVAISCTAKLPSLRPNMREVANRLRDAYPGAEANMANDYGNKSVQGTTERGRDSNRNMAGGTEEELKLDRTPTWIVAIVCTIIVCISLFFERFLHYLGKRFKRKNQKPLFQALQKIKEELMLMGFISLLLVVFQSAIQKICVPESLTRHLRPCKSNDDASDEEVSSNHGTAHYRTDFVVGVLGSGRRLLAGGESGSAHCASKAKWTVRSSTGVVDDMLRHGAILENSFTFGENTMGKVPLLSVEAIHQLHIFIFALATTHVILSVLTMVLGSAKISRWKHWEDSIHKETDENVSEPTITYVHQTEFVKGHFLGIGKNSVILSWLHSFFKHIFGSVTLSDYKTMRLGFIMAHCKGNRKFDFHKYMVRALEADFKKIVGLSWYLWIFVVVFLFLNIGGWHAYFWISFVPMVLLLALGTKLEHIITQLAHDVAEKHSAIEGDLVIQPSDDHFWFHRPQIVLFLIHLILFQNAFEIAYFFWILTTFGYHSCIMDSSKYLIPRLVICVIIQIICSYSTLPLYAIVTQMGSSFKPAIFDEYVQEGLLQWAQKVKKGRKMSSIGKVSSGAPKAEDVQLQQVSNYEDPLMKESRVEIVDVSSDHS
ncbi:hypothetical protein HPP92_016128 [Vanilla planifolia]|uniref:non-specific serine/threonine protein kinase n=1 Tax=Vanilla planifolia TaxID=51239 RepID=A0A835QIQ0_VANPL|nr:hypothetical protein HPP92_016128 [Vanilla planifolia]